MNVLKKAREEGLSLRLTYILMLVITVTVTVVLLVMTYRAINSFHALSKATDRYIDMQDAASGLMSASDYLTEEAQCYAILGDRVHLDNYFREAEQDRRREKAIETMGNSLPDSSALTELKEAMAQSVSLMDTEYYAMLLILSAEGDDDIPETMRGLRLSAEDEALTPAGKKALAAQLMHGDSYCEQKDRIRLHLGQCITALKSSTHGTQEDMERRMHADLIWIAALIVLQSVDLVLMLEITTKLGLNPLLQAVEHIKQDQSLPIMGAHEFRYLASTYNKMYSAYKRSIRNLSYKASHDVLTGAYNRAGFDLITDSIDPDSTAVILFDADRFKDVNDEHGHDVGDLVLKNLVKTLRKYFRTDDYVCRIGGDEFAVLMVHVEERSRVLIEKKIEQINRDLLATQDGLPPITVSAGVSYCREGRTMHEVLHEADVALYHVKHNGKKGCCFYDSSMHDI